VSPRLSGPEHDVAADAGYDAPPRRMGFFTDTSICIGCKACEVACKEWNAVPDDGYELLGMSYDNTGMLGASTWRHVAFIEQSKPVGQQWTGLEGLPTGPAVSEQVGERVAGAMSHLPATKLGTDTGALDVLGVLGQAPPAPSTSPAGESRTELRWLMASDVCKHCTHAGCLDVCPTGSLFRTEFGTVVVQEDICNGCGYCVPACPYGVIDRREEDGRAWKCTLCYDRIGHGQTPACAQACPTQSIQFGPLDELRERARDRVAELVAAGVPEARLYGEDPADGVGGAGAFFLLLDEPEVYGFPPDPVVPTRDVVSMWRHAAAAAGVMLLAGAAAFIGGSDR
jgi:formate dehydrogenase iron-sulfur subunit